MATNQQTREPAETQAQPPSAAEAAPQSKKSHKSTLVIALISAFVAGFSAAFLYSRTGTQFPLDDAWIHLSYALSINLSDGISYNPGDWETGFSSPLWLFLLTLIPKGPPIVLHVKLLGCAIHGLLTVVCFCLARDLRLRLSPARGFSAWAPPCIAAMLIALHPTFLETANSGMEAGLAALLVMTFLLLYERQFLKLSTLVAAAAALARIETLIVVCAFPLLTIYVVKPRSLTHILKLLAPAAAGMGALVAIMAYCIWHSGYIFPNTFYGKSDAFTPFNLAYIWYRIVPSEPWIISGIGVILFARAVSLYRNKVDDLILRLGITYVVSIIAICTLVGLHNNLLFFHMRYFVPFMAIPAVILVQGIEFHAKVVTIGLAGVMLLVSAYLTSTRYDNTRLQETGIDILHRDPAQYMNDNYHGELTVLVEPAGIRYNLPRSFKIIDLIGLNDRFLAHEKDFTKRACYLIKQNPKLALLPKDLFQILSNIFDMKLVKMFVDPQNAQSDPIIPYAMAFAEIQDIKPAFRQCLNP